MPQIFLEFCQGARDREVVRWKHDGAWVGQRGDAMLEEACGLTLWLDSVGVALGDRVCILAPPVPVWSLVDVGVLCARAVTVGIYTSMSASQMQYLIAHSKARSPFCPSEALFDRGRSVVAGMTALVRGVS